MSRTEVMDNNLLFKLSNEEMRGTDETTMVKNYQRLHGIAGKRSRDVSWAKCTGLWWVL
jgi:hypothetical protein